MKQIEFIKNITCQICKITKQPCFTSTYVFHKCQFTRVKLAPIIYCHFSNCVEINGSNILNSFYCYKYKIYNFRTILSIVVLFLLIRSRCAFIHFEQESAIPTELANTTLRGCRGQNPLPLF